MMNVDNDEMDLGLALGYSNQCVRTRLNNNSGAGVNAGSSSTVDMTFVASDPLSELVWSPHKGLSLKCADSSLADKKPPLLWDVGPSNMVLSPSQSFRSRGTIGDKPIDQGNLITSPATCHVDSEVADRAILARSSSSTGPVFRSNHGHHMGNGTGSNMEEVNTLEGVNVVHFNQKEEDLRDSEEKGLCCPKNSQIADIAEASENNAGQENQRTTDFPPLGTNECRPDMEMAELLSGKFYKEMMTNQIGRIEDVASGSRALGLEVALASEVHTFKQCEVLDSPVPNLPSQGRRRKDLSLSTEEESRNKMKTNGSTSGPPVGKLESTSENDLQHLISKDACGQSEERPSRDMFLPLEASPTNSRILLNQRKGKEKASDVDVNERMSKDEVNSHESVESCNFEQQLIGGSKRIKKQIQENPASTSLAKQDSSFMNWISNMVKGLVKSNQEDAPPRPVTLPHPNHGHGSRDQKIITCNENHDSGSRNMGFQSIFQSLYCPNTKVQELRMSSDDYSEVRSKELVLADKMCHTNIIPMACHGENDKSSKQFLVSNEKFSQSTSGNGSGPSTQPRILSVNIAATQVTCKTNSAENKTSRNLACSKAKDGISSSNSSLGKRKANTAENNSSDPPSEGKAIHNIGCRNDLLGSLWVTRFYPKIDFSIVQKSSEAREYSAEDPVNVVGKELQNDAPNTEASFGFKRIHGLNYQKSIHKLNPILPSQKFKSPEAIASVFARRLGSLKHIIPSGVNDDATRTVTTCFFCGRSGHDLRHCSEITETELEDLLRNISSYDGAEESPCLCIRCFQLDHWAITCPVTSSSRQQQSEHGASLVNNYSASKMQLPTGNERNSSMLETKESHPRVAGEHIICNGKKPRVDTDPSLNLTWNMKMLCERRSSSLDEVQKHIASTSGENKLKENQITPLCAIFSKQTPDVPKGMFDAIRRLRLSRMDILKWMNSHISLSHLDGFFLRLRLGKWEEGLGGTGYYVACITGAQREKSPTYSKNLISVNVGGIECLVESQYVSNHDFLEDELMAWWCTTSKSGGKILSEDDLKLKLEERKRLGF